MFEIKASASFDAAHFLRDYQGPCARMHGHTWRVEAAVEGAELGPGQMIIDFCDLRKALQEVIEPFDHRCLNEIAPFDRLSPTSENIACHLYRRLKERLGELPAGVSLAWVGVSESPHTGVVYRGEE
jgi:6-pyruvoyltetrahydropterin/6-carboxytetrahydropterin synthase